MNRMSWFMGLILLSAFPVLAGLPQPAAHAVDTTSPTGTIVINNGRSATNNPNVTLALTWDDGVGGSGVSRMRFSDDGSHWSAWEVLAATLAYTLPSGPDGHRTVRVQYLDRANNRSLVYSDYILLDTTLPTGSIIINGGAATTVSQAVALGLAWSDGTGAGVSRMRFSGNGSTWTAWVPPTATSVHTLTPLNGYHTVRVQYLDRVGNYSAAYSDYIKLVLPILTEETVMLRGSVPLVMVWIPGGTFMMGRYPGEQGSTPHEDPQHAVTLGGFWMAKFELTKRQWKAVMGTAPWTGQDYVLADLDSPAVYVSWNDAQSFLTRLSGYTGKSFSLPGEAQWEYACRAGTTTRFYWGDDPSYTAIGDYAWYWGNCSSELYAHVVGQKLPNAFGLYDMSGNVWEWCADDWHTNYTGAPIGGQAWVDTPRGSDRLLRGGDWDGSGGALRSTNRDVNLPDSTYSPYGFRIAQTP